MGVVVGLATVEVVGGAIGGGFTTTAGFTTVDVFAGGGTTTGVVGVGLAIAELALPDSSKFTSSLGAFTYRLESCHLKSFTYKVKSI